MPQRPTRRVEEAELRRVFNEGRFHDRLTAGELIEVIEREGTPDPRNGQPPGTVSRTSWYTKPGPGLGFEKVALVHYYLLADGSIGGSGRHDPKRLILDGVILLP